MSALQPLDPAPFVERAGVLFTGTAAARTDRGLRCTVQCERDGRIYDTPTLLLTDRTEREKVAEGLAPLVALDAEGVVAALLELHPKAEEALRDREARRGSARVQTGAYSTHEGRLCRLVGGALIPLCNFDGRIIREVTVDDGAEQHGEMEISATQLGELLGVARVSFRDFAAMNWPLTAFGTRAIVEPGMNSREHLRAALQTLSTDVERVRITAHSGWKQIGGVWRYLSGSGGIGPDGLDPSIQVRLSPQLEPLQLPRPPDGEELRTAIRSSIAVLDVAPLAVTAPLLGATYRAPLAEVLAPDTSVFLEGQSGQLKSEICALAQAHFGAGFTRLTLPASWEDTANSIERLGFEAKDALLVIDDFKPKGTPQEHARLHAAADRVFRGAGNRSGRGRMHPDGSLRRSYRPRGLYISSGEDKPKGQSLAARLVLVAVPKGSVHGKRSVLGDRLAAAQHAAEVGTFAEAMAGYLRWLALRIDSLRVSLPRRRASLRIALDTGDTHLRTPDALAHLLLGWETWLDFARDAGAVSADEATALLGRVQKALIALGREQAEEGRRRDPARHFLALLASSLEGQRAHMTRRDGSMPDEPQRYGWRLIPRTVSGRDGPQEIQEWQIPGGSRLVGWVVDSENLYLQPNGAYAAATTLGVDVGEPLEVSEDTLWRRLRDAGLLASVDATRDRLKVQRVIATGSRTYVIHLHVHSLFGADSGTTGTSDAETGAAREGPPSNVPDSRSGLEKVVGEPAHKTGTHDTRNQREDAERMPGVPDVPGSVMDMLPATSREAVVSSPWEITL